MPMTDDAGRITPVILSGGAGTRLWPLSRAGAAQAVARSGRRGLDAGAHRRAGGRAPACSRAPIVVAGAAQAADIAAALPDWRADPGALAAQHRAGDRAGGAGGGRRTICCWSCRATIISRTRRASGRRCGGRRRPRGTAGSSPSGWRPSGPRPATAISSAARRWPRACTSGALRREARRRDRRGLSRGRAATTGTAASSCSARAPARRRSPNIAPEVLQAAKAAMAGARRRRAAVIRPDAAAFAAAPADLDRLCGDGESRQGRGRAGRDRLVRHRQLGGAAHRGGRSTATAMSLAGDVLALDAKGCLVRSEGPVVAAIGVEDLVIVATGGRGAGRAARREPAGEGRGRGAEAQGDGTNGL